MAQDPEKRRGIDEKDTQSSYPKTWIYLKQFEASLRQRKAHGVSDMVEKGAPFYTMFAISGYTFAPYKVVWREQATSLTASVVGSHQGKPIIPDHKLMLIECLTASEAHYLCAMLNSNLAVFAAKCYAVETQTDTHIVENIRIPKYDSQNTFHLTLAKLSEQAHKLAEADDEKGLNLVEDKVDQAAGELWGLTEEELTEIKESLDEIT